jgi:pimeloyl-ACP methyl ester carboxylesterase
VKPRHLLPGALAVGGLALVGTQAAVSRCARTIQTRVDPQLDPLYDLPPDVIRHDLPSADGGLIHVLERGAGRPLLLIHGVTLQARIWAPQLNLMADRYRVLAMDVRGHGRSTAGTDGFGRRLAARDLATVLDHFDLEGTIVVGHSMGGMILMEFAGRYVDLLARRVAGLVFMATAAYQIAPRAARPLAQAWGRRMLSRDDPGRPGPPGRPGRAEPGDQPGEGNLSWVLARMAFGARPSARAVAEIRTCGAEIARSASIASGLDLLDHDARPALAATSTPSMVLVGSRDLLTPVYAARRIARSLPQTRLEVIRGAGHQLMQERPLEVAELLDQFSASLPPTSR